MSNYIFRRCCQSLCEAKLCNDAIVLCVSVCKGGYYIQERKKKRKSWTTDLKFTLLYRITYWFLKIHIILKAQQRTNLICTLQHTMGKMTITKLW